MSTKNQEYKIKQFYEKINKNIFLINGNFLLQKSQLKAEKVNLRSSKLDLRMPAKQKERKTYVEEFQNNRFFFLNKITEYCQHFQSIENVNENKIHQKI